MAGHLRISSAATVMEVLGDGMTGGLAFDGAVNEILLGRCDICVALGVSLETGVPSGEHMDITMRAVGDVDFQAPFGFTPIAWYAMDAVRYMHEYGVSREQLASVSLKNRRHARLNPIAQYTDELTLEEILEAKPIVEPLGLLEVPPRSDGAVAVVLASSEAARNVGRSGGVKVRGRGFYHEGAHQISDKPNSMIRLEAARRASQLAYEDAGVSVVDIDFAEIYAPCTIVEVLASEAFGFCPEGRGALWAEEGETALGGSIPICTSGGLLSRGHPPMVTRCTVWSRWSSSCAARRGRARWRAPGWASPAASSATTTPLSYTSSSKESSRSCVRRRGTLPRRLSPAHNRSHPTLLGGLEGRALLDHPLRRLRRHDLPAQGHLSQLFLRAAVVAAPQRHGYSLLLHHRVWAAPAVFGDEVPYTLCVVDLDERLRVASRLLLDDHASPEVGARVSLVFLHYEDVTLYGFEPGDG